jgi:iron complex outermembrane recepter protein
MKQFVLAAFIFAGSLPVLAQDSTFTDSSKILPEVTVTAFGQNRGGVSAGTLVKVVRLNYAGDRYNKTSLVHAFNAVAGVRMEERSPGSYRLNIRGSSLRAPFGVRNVKVYWNNIPITDPGGNTYFNQFSFNNFSYMEVIKGPAGSLYGAGTGGVMLAHSITNGWKEGAQAEYVTGSYGLHNILASVHWGKKENKNTIAYSHNQSDGYRDNTKMRRDNLMWSTRLNINDRQQLEGHFLFNNMYYQTPGGLTLAEFNANPKQARPAAGAFPSAQTARATIYQKNFLAGVTHHYRFSEVFHNTSTLYGAFAQIENPTFRNYERRNEPHVGGRTNFTFEKNWKQTKLQLIAGAEIQQGYFNIQVSRNNAGNPDTLQTNDDVEFTASTIFAQADIDLFNSLSITVGASINKSRIEFERLSRYPVIKQTRTYENEISPRIAIQQRLGNMFTVFGSVARGFSPPTTAELLPSTSVISTFLEAEDGINYELGTRINLLDERLQFDVTGFYFKVDNALVVRKDSSNADYYVNAGNTDQKGIELNIDFRQPFAPSFLLEFVEIRTAQSFYDFKYGDFQKESTDFSGKRLPSVPSYTASVLGDIQFRAGLYLSGTWYHASRIYLNDANSVEAPRYDLLGARIGWRFKINRVQLNIYGGADNLLDEVYSLGNDINAAGGRYYNAAPARNYYGGIAVRW